MLAEVRGVCPSTAWPPRISRARAQVSGPSGSKRGWTHAGAKDWQPPPRPRHVGQRSIGACRRGCDRHVRARRADLGLVSLRLGSRRRSGRGHGDAVATSGVMGAVSGWRGRTGALHLWTVAPRAPRGPGGGRHAHGSRTVAGDGIRARRRRGRLRPGPAARLTSGGVGVRSAGADAGQPHVLADAGARRCRHACLLAVGRRQGGPVRAARRGQSSRRASSGARFPAPSADVRAYAR